MQAPGNYLWQTVVGTALVILCLLGLYAVPEFDVGSFHFKRINILGDILQKPAIVKTTTDTTLVKAIKPRYVDTCKTGVMCIEDYSPDTTGMNAFYKALEHSKKRVVRIAYFADSYVEGDIMLETLRDSLQSLYGGSGVGFVPITSEVAGFRQTVVHSFNGWHTYSMVGERSPEHPLGPAGFTFTPFTDSKVTYHTIARQRLNNFPTTHIYYGNADSATLSVNGGDTLSLRNTSRIQSFAINHPLQSLSIKVPSSKSLDLYGVSFEDTVGVAVDNFSMRGNSGIGLSYVTEQMYRNFDSLHHYDLVVMAYGLNVASEKAKDYTWYIRSMDQTVKIIRRAFPHSSILLVGCSDRAAKVDGEMTTMPMLKELIDVQRQLAADNGVCFYNLFDAMGGDSTMVRWANCSPPLANKDYTHITFAGGRKLAHIMLNTLLYEQERYERKKRNKI